MTDRTPHARRRLQRMSALARAREGTMNAKIEDSSRPPQDTTVSVALVFDVDIRRRRK